MGAWSKVIPCPSKMKSVRRGPRCDDRFRAAALFLQLCGDGGRRQLQGLTLAELDAVRLDA